MRMQTYWVGILKVTRRNIGLFQRCIVVEYVNRKGN
jgi:hypothetical protein